MSSTSTTWTTDTNTKSGTVQIYESNVSTLKITGVESGDAVLELFADQGDDNADKWRMWTASSDNDLHFSNYTSGAWADKLTIQDGGNVGIGTNDPTSQVSADVFLEIKKASGIAGLALNGGGASRWELTSDTGDDYIISRNGTARFKIDGSTGDSYTNDASLSSLSDVRIKKNIADLTDGLDIINQLKPRTYKFNGKASMAIDDDVTRYGFIADEVMEVTTNYTSVGVGVIDGSEVDDLKSLSMTRMIPMLVKAIQELSAKVTALENK